jgi:hypothetical protein
MASSVFKGPPPLVALRPAVLAGGADGHRPAPAPYRAMRLGISVAFGPVLLIGRQLLGREPYVVPARIRRPYTSGTPVTVTEEATSPTTFGGTQDVMIAVTWTSQVSRLLARIAMAGGSVS